MDKIIAQGLVSEGPFNDFLTKGLYDPRIFLRIYAFVLDENYLAVCQQYPEYGYDPAQYDAYQKRLAEIKNFGPTSWIKDISMVISFVPFHYITEELLSAAFAKGYSWDRVKKHQRTLKLYLKYIKIRGVHFAVSINLVDECKDIQHYALYLQAVQKNGLALQFIKDEFKHESLCLEAVRQNGLALQYIDDSIKSYKICLEAVKQNGLALQFISEDMKKYEIVYDALFEETVKQNHLAIKFVPEICLSSKIYLFVVGRNGIYLEHVPEKYKTTILCRAAVKQNHLAIKFVPPERRTEELYQLVVQQNGLYLEHIPEKNKTYVVCFEAVKQNGLALHFVSEEFKMFAS